MRRANLAGRSVPQGTFLAVPRNMAVIVFEGDKIFGERMYMDTTLFQGDERGPWPGLRRCPGSLPTGDESSTTRGADGSSPGARRQSQSLIRLFYRPICQRMFRNEMCCNTHTLKGSKKHS